MITSDLFTNNSPALFENTGPVTHRIGLTVTDPNHPMVSKRGETIQKTVRVTGDDKEKAINSAIAHYRRKGYRVHDHHYIGTVDQGVAEGVAETLSLDDALKVLRQYGAGHFKTTSNELHFYKNGRPFSVDLIWNDDATRSVSLSNLNSATRGLKGQGVAEGKKPDSYHIVNKDGKPATLASYADKTSAEKDRDAKHPGAEVRQLGPRGKVKNVSEVSLGDYRKKAQLSQAGAKINKFFDRDDAAKAAAADQTIAKRERGLARADARIKPYTPPKFDAEKHQRDLTAKYPNIDELVADAEKRRDPYYDRAEGNAYYAGREAEQNYQKLKQIQRVIQGLNESQAPFKKNYLYEGLDRGGLQTVKLWESAGQRIMEAELTADQINQLFTAAEQGATAAGGNRTMLGKGKDAAVAVNNAWEDLKTKVQNSGPIKSVDAAYDSAAEKLKQATGGDQGVMKYVEKYRAFAKAHPVAQSLIYSALIAAAGISGAGVGGAAALGLFKLVDKLLQGEKFSSAAYSGAKTGAMAYGASKVADYFKGPKAPEGGGGLDPNDPDVAEFNRDVADIEGAANQLPGGSGTLVGGQPIDAQMAQGLPSKIPLDATGAATNIASQAASKSVSGAISAGKDYIAQGGGTDYSSLKKAAEAYYDQLDAMGVSADRANMLVNAFRTAAQGEAATALGGNAISTAGSALQSMARESKQFKPLQLTEADLYFIFSATTQLNEGVWDSIKGAAGKAADWAKTKGTNLTTKVTADKLKSAWTKAGSPTDSDQVYGIMIQAGVAPQVLDTVYKSMNVPTFKEKVLTKPTTPPVSGSLAPTAPTPPSATPPASASTPEPAATTTPASATPPGFNAGNLAQLPGMAQYMKPQPKGTPNYGGAKGYGKTTMSVSPMQAKTPAPATKPAAPAAAPAVKKEPITIGGQKITPNDPAYAKIMKNAPAMAESLTWSNSFDPGRSLYRQMKKES